MNPTLFAALLGLLLAPGPLAGLGPAVEAVPAAIDAGSGTTLGGTVYGGVVPTAPITPTAGPSPTPLPTATAVVNGNSVPPPIVDGTDISLFVLIFVGIFAAVGFLRGSRREFPALLLILPAYLLFSQGWPLVASLINRVWRISSVAAAEGSNPQSIMDALLGGGGGEGGPLMGSSADAPMAQIATFGLAMLVVYMVTRGGPEANGLERIVGAVIGGAIGYLAGVFVLSRVVPNATVTLLSPGSTALAWLNRLGPLAALILVGATILYGFRSLGPGPSGSKQRYG